MIGLDAVNNLRLRTGNRIPQSSQFTVPKSAIRADGARIHGRDAGRSLATDTVELSGLLPFPAPVAAQETPPVNAGFSGQSDDTKKDSAPGTPAGDADDPIAAEESESGDEGSGPGQATDARGEPLDEDEQRQVKELKNRDREVRQHEQAHKAAGGRYAGAISYDYQQGPDGRRYAVGGEVSIDVSPENEPEATIAKMRQVRAAALAPAEPSSQDQSVAAEASKIEAEARQELQQEQTEKASGNGGQNADGEDGENEEGAAGEATNTGGRAASGGVGIETGDNGNSPLSPASESEMIRPASRRGGNYARLSSALIPPAGSMAFAGQRGIDVYA